MTRRKIEDFLINTGNIIGTDYKPYRVWLRNDIKKVLTKYKNELRAHILLHRREDAYAAAEERFFGSGRGTI